MEDTINNSKDSQRNLHGIIENPYATKYRETRKPKRKKFKLGDFLLKKGLNLLGSLFVLGGIFLLLKTKFAYLFSLLGIHEKHAVKTYEIPSFSLSSNFQSFTNISFFLPGLILILIAYFTTKKITLNKILSILGFGIIYYNLFYLLVNSLLTIYQSAFIILIITILGIVISFRLGQYLIGLFVIIMNFISLFILYQDQYYIIIFPTVIILNSIYAFAAIKRKWHILITMANILTLLYFGFWLVRKIMLFNLTYYPPFSFILFLVISLSALLPLLLYTFKIKENFSNIDYFNFTGVTLFYSLFGIALLSKLGYSEFTGIFCLLAGFLNFFIFRFFRHKQFPVYIYLFLAYSILLFSIVLPLQTGYYQLLFFLISFSVLILWFAKTQLNKIYIWLSVGSAILIFSIYLIYMIEGLIVMIFSIDVGVFDKNFSRCSFAGFFIAASYLISNYLLDQNSTFFVDKKGFLLYGLKFKNYSRTLKLLSFSILYPSFFYYLNYIFSHYHSIEVLSTQATYAFSLIYLIFLVSYSNLNHEKVLKATFIVFSVIICMLYPIEIHGNNVLIRNLFVLSHEAGPGFFILHYINLLLIVLILYMSYHYLNKKFKQTTLIMYVVHILIAFLGVFVITTEYNHLSIIAQYSSYGDIDSVLRTTTTIGFTLIWVVCSFFLIYLSIKFHIAIFRTLALLLVFFTIVKIFAYDIDKISQDSLNVMLIIFGILLFILSVTYRKLRKLIFTKEPPRKQPHRHG